MELTRWEFMQFAGVAKLIEISFFLLLFKFLAVAGFFELQELQISQI